jgi:hypothetical protein
VLVFAAIVELSGKKVAKPSHVPFSDCKLRWPADDSEVVILSYKGFITAVSVCRFQLFFKQNHDILWHTQTAILLRASRIAILTYSFARKGPCREKYALFK